MRVQHLSVLTISLCIGAATLVGCAGTDGASGTGVGDVSIDVGPSSDAGITNDSGASTADTATTGDDAGGEKDSATGKDAATTKDVVTTKDAGEPDVGGEADAGGAMDAGGEADAGGATDAGGVTDAGGEADAGGATDAGGVTDAGGEADAGGPTDAGGTPDSASGDTMSTPDGFVPKPGCCKIDSHCKKGQVCFFGPFKAGKCMTTSTLSKGQCWTSAQCGAGSKCEGAQACGCDAICKAMDKPGTCSKPVTGNKCVIGKGAKDTDCGAGNFCKLPKAGCAGEGVCTAKPKMCTKQYAPVCGCDGKTYGNDCMAASAGRNIKTKGKCALNPCATVKCGDGNACTSDACDPKTGKCVFKPLKGAKCEDGNLCTLGDVCDISATGKGYCAAGKNTKVCNPGTKCELSSCNPKTGLCVSKSIPNCNYGKKCSLGLGAPTIDCGKGGYCKLPSGSACVGFGLCEPKPLLCTKELKQVCACDGKTYGNLCLAQFNGQNAKSDGKCGGGVPGCCKIDTDCQKAHVCIDGGKTGKGTCKSLLALGKNQCWSTAQCGVGTCTGASVCPCGALCIIADKPGYCANGPIACTVGKNTTCAKGQYCSGPCGGKGKCTTPPVVCPKVLDPVCGCNGKTYSNACLAAAAGVSVKAKGACNVTPKGCCKGQSDCQYKDDVCVMSSNTKAGMCKNTKGLKVGQCWNDNQCGGGTCSGAIICPCGSNCKAADVPGKCIKPVPTCTVGGKNTCAANEFCDGKCGHAGKCMPKPVMCPMVYKPVCGCNYKTYGNSCSAQAAGVAVGSEGACPKVGPGCCAADAQCKIGVCVAGATGNGVCKATLTLPKGQCWTDAQCGKLSCVGAQACPCNAKCLMPDKAGTCQ